MDKKNDNEETGSPPDVISESTPAEIELFAEALGIETSKKYWCYLYRRIKNEHGRPETRSYLHKYTGDEPVDPDLIANTYRGGKYLLQFFWRVSGSKPKSKAFAFDVDMDEFPVLPKQPANSLMPVNAGGLSEQAQLQLTMIHAITEVMKVAAQNAPANKSLPMNDPSAMMESMMDMIEQSYGTLFKVQGRVMQKALENKFLGQVGADGQLSSDAGLTPEAEPGIMEKYGPLITTVIEGVKGLFSTFGDKVPKSIVREVSRNDRFQVLRNDKRALAVVSAALVKEFGMDKAREIVRTFGVELITPAPVVVKTPDIGKRPVPDAKAVPGNGTPINKPIAGKIKPKPGEEGKRVKALAVA